MPVAEQAKREVRSDLTARACDQDTHAVTAL